MKKPGKYKFYFRPAHDSENLLIEFISGVENADFGKDIFDAIKNISPKIIGQEDLWMNDEVLYSVDSTFGIFTLSKDVWNLAFIMNENNQPVLTKINELLIKDDRFQKIEVNSDSREKV